jgi:hypothetical protein
MLLLSTNEVSLGNIRSNSTSNRLSYISFTEDGTAYPESSIKFKINIDIDIRIYI